MCEGENSLRLEESNRRIEDLQREMQYLLTSTTDLRSQLTEGEQKNAHLENLVSAHESNFQGLQETLDKMQEERSAALTMRQEIDDVMDQLRVERAKAQESQDRYQE